MCSTKPLTLGHKKGKMLERERERERASEHVIGSQVKITGILAISGTEAIIQWFQVLERK